MKRLAAQGAQHVHGQILVLRVLGGDDVGVGAAEDFSAGGAAQTGPVRLRALQGGGIEAGGGRQVAGSGKNDAVGQLTAASGTADTALQYGIHPQHLRSAEN